MKLRILSILTAAALLLSLAACGNSPAGTESGDPAASQIPAVSSRPAETPAPPMEPEQSIDILDGSGELLGKIDSRAACTAADAGIFYCVFAPEGEKATADAEYHFFRVSDKKDIFLGRVEDQGYEVMDARTELDGIVYTLALSGDARDQLPDTLWLLAVNGAEGKMDRYQVSG